jgi:hypothetical protein
MTTLQTLWTNFNSGHAIAIAINLKLTVFNILCSSICAQLLWLLIYEWEETQTSIWRRVLATSRGQVAAAARPPANTPAAKLAPSTLETFGSGPATSSKWRRTCTTMKLGQKSHDNKMPLHIKRHIFYALKLRSTKHRDDELTGSKVVQQMAENGTSRANCAPTPAHSILSLCTVHHNAPVLLSNPLCIHLHTQTTSIFNITYKKSGSYGQQNLWHQGYNHNLGAWNQKTCDVATVNITLVTAQASGPPELGLQSGNKKHTGTTLYPFSSWKGIV